MVDVVSVQRCAAALRTALVDHKMLRFEAPRLIGVVPRAGRIIERVEARGRHVEIEWDDGIVLHSKLRTGATWQVFRSDEPWRRSQSAMRATIAVDGWVAVCFDASVIETFRTPSIPRHPGIARLGPDLGRPDADLRRSVDLLLSYDPPSTPIADVLLDPQVLVGLGNVYRSEVLWLCQLHPQAAVGAITEALGSHLVQVAAMVVRHNLAHGRRIDVPSVPGGGLAVYGRTGQRCSRCADSVLADAFGSSGRVLYWCPGCQVRQQPRRDHDDTPTDQHPAARLFLEELRRRRMDAARRR